MAAADQGAQLVSDFHVTLDGSDLPPDAVTDLVAATVHDDVEHPSAFSITLHNWDADKIDMKWSEGDLFKIGKVVELQMGYLGKLDTLITGEITGLELLIEEESLPQLVVRGYDRGHRLTRGRHTLSYTSMKDSDIAAQIAGNYGLSSKVDETSETFKYLLQHDQTDAAFLRERARRIGYECFVRDKTLYFRALANSTQPAITLKREEGLLFFNPRLSTMHQSNSVEMRSWDITEKKALIGRAASSDETAKMGGAAVGLDAAADAFGDAAFTSGTHPVMSQADADQRARGRLKEMALSYIHAEGTSAGRTDLRAGSVVQVEGMGKRFTGMYYVCSTLHSYLPGAGYRTNFQARRTAL